MKSLGKMTRGLGFQPLRGYEVRRIGKAGTPLHPMIFVSGHFGLFAFSFLECRVGGYSNCEL